MTAMSLCSFSRWVCAVSASGFLAAGLLSYHKFAVGDEPTRSQTEKPATEGAAAAGSSSVRPQPAASTSNPEPSAKPKYTPEQQRRLDEATNLHHQFEELCRQGQYVEAAKVDQQAIEIRKEILGDKHPDYAISLANLAKMYRDIGEYTKAEPLLRTANEIYKESLGEDNFLYILSLWDLGGVYVQMREFAKAEPYYKQVCDIFKKSLGPKHPQYAISLGSLAGLYCDMQDFVKAEQTYRLASEICKEAHGEKNPLYGDSLKSLALMYASMGEYQKAEPLLQQAITIRKDALGERDVFYIGTLNNLASLYEQIGDYFKAESLYQQVIAIQKRVVGEKRAEYVQSLNNLAALYDAEGDYHKAESLYLKAIAIRKELQGEKHPDYADNVNSLALVYESLGDFAKADQLLQQVRTIYADTVGKKHPWYARSLNNLGWLYFSMGDYLKAEPLYQEACEVRREALGEKHPLYAQSLSNLALLYKNMGDYGKAEPLCLKANDIRKEILGENALEYAQSLDELALLYDGMGDAAKGESLAHQAIGIARRQLDSMAVVQSEFEQLRLAKGMRRYLDAYLTVASAAGTPAEQVYAEVLAWKGASSARQRWMHAAREALEANSDAQRLYLALESKSHALAGIYQTAAYLRQERENTDVSALSHEVESLQQQLSEISQEFGAARKAARYTPQELQRRLPTGTALVDIIEYRCFNKIETTADKRSWQRRLIAFVVRPGQPIKLVEIGPSSRIAQAVLLWRVANLPNEVPDEEKPLIDLLAKAWRSAYGASSSPSRQLGDWVWKPIAPHLGDSSTVLISPDGALSYFPWAVLPGKQADHCLLEDVALALAPVPQLLPEILDAPAKVYNSDQAMSMLLMGDVHMKGDAGVPRLPRPTAAAQVSIDQRQSFDDIPRSREQIAAIGRSFSSTFPQGHVKLLAGDEPTEQSFRDLAPSATFIHLAVHGFFEPNRHLARNKRGSETVSSALASDADAALTHPDLQCGLAFVGAGLPPQQDKDNGILTGLELRTLNLEHVELATLTACQSALGLQSPGEGVLGIQRAFQLAGAHSSVASLWSVPIHETDILMEDFYDNLWNKKLSRVESLRRAQLKMMREGGKDLAQETGHPELADKPLPSFFWAAFVLAGDWR